MEIFSKLRIITVEPVMFLYALCIMLESNGLQELMLVKTCLKLNHTTNLSDCGLQGSMSEEIKNEVTNWMKYYYLALNLANFVTMLYIGPWNDRFGHKVIMLIPCLGTIVAATVNTILSVYIFTSIAFFFVPAVISGLTFGLLGVIASTFSYTSDCGTKQTRSSRIVILETMIFVGMSSGSYLAGVFVKNISIESKMNGFVSMFCFEGIVCVSLVIYIICILPSIQTEGMKSKPRTCYELFNVKHIINSFKTVFRRREHGKRGQIILMLVALNFSFLKNIVLRTLGYLYLKSLDWSFDKFTNFSTMMSISELVGLIGGFFIMRYTRISDYTVGILGTISRMVMLALYGLSSSDAMVYSCIPFVLLSGLPVPALRSLLSKTVDADEKGRIFAATGIVENINYLVGSFVLITLFTATFKGFCFILSSGLQLVSLCIIIYLMCTKRDVTTIYNTMENEDGSTEVRNVIAEDD